MPLVLIEFLHRRAMMIPSDTSFHGGSCTHRLKHLEKWNRRATMDVSPLENPFSEYIRSLNDHNESYYDHNQHTHSEKNTSNNEAAEIGKSLCDILHDQDAPELVSNGIPVINHPEKTNICKESKLNLVSSPTSTTQKRFSKSATFPCSKVELLDQPFTEGMHEPEPHTMKSENAACTRSISLPTPSKLVSALKGGRENQGIPPKKLSLKWSPEVYDPPVTSLSHTVKGHRHHRSRSTKKTTKHKHKGNSSHNSSSSSSSSDKKQYRKYAGKSESRSKTLATRDRLQSCDSKPRETRDRLQFGDSKTRETRETLLISDFNKSTIELLDFAVGGQDTKCGSSYLRTSLATLHLSVAEAT